MIEVDVKAPGVVKLYGEHAVVYGRLSVAAAIDMYALASIKKVDGKVLRIVLADYDNLSITFHQGRLRLLYESYKGKESLEYYVKENKDIDQRILPYLTIAATLANDFYLDVFGREVTITSEIPEQSGCASSAACSTAFTVAMLASAGSVSEDTIANQAVLEIARDGERVVHLNEKAGLIDVVTSYYGGYVSTADGGRQEDISTDMNMVLIDTGPKQKTAETVRSVRVLYDRDKARTEKKFDKINECAVNGLAALSGGDLEKAGEYMYKNQEILRELGVSSDGLDKAVELAMKNGAYGAKLSGGGRGGLAIAICRDPESLIDIMEKNGFKAQEVSVSFRGACSYIE